MNTIRTVTIVLEEKNINRTTKTMLKKWKALLADPARSYNKCCLVMCPVRANGSSPLRDSIPPTYFFGNRYSTGKVLANGAPAHLDMRDKRSNFPCLWGLPVTEHNAAWKKLAPFRARPVRIQRFDDGRWHISACAWSDARKDRLKKVPRRSPVAAPAPPPAQVASAAWEDNTTVSDSEEEENQCEPSVPRKRLRDHVDPLPLYHLAGSKKRKAVSPVRHECARVPEEPLLTGSKKRKAALFEHDTW